jgi:hypothetical protein
MIIQSSTLLINFILAGGVPLSEGITFVADLPHYLLDFGTDTDHNRVSIFKDPSGYFNFRVIDKNGIVSIVSSNIASWLPGDLHQIAAAWKINSLNGRDEIHLFIDGFEAPNLIRYGNNVEPYLDEAYRTVNPEQIAGMIIGNVVSGHDLITTIGSNIVSSGTNFISDGIINGNTIIINEAGFSTTPYTITSVSANTLTLSTTMPFSITNGAFVINQVSFDTQNEIDIYPNIAVSTISSIFNNTDGSIGSTSSTFSSASSNFNTIGVLPGYLIRIDNVAFLSSYMVLSVPTSTTLIINAAAPITVSGASFHIYKNNPTEIPGTRALRPSYIIGDDASYNSQLTIINDAHTYDLILIDTLGINHQRVQQQLYQWGSDGYGDDGYGFDGYDNSNIINTYLPTPISLNQVSITHILLGNQLISSANSTVIGSVFTSNNFTGIDWLTNSNGNINTPSYSSS